MANQNKLVRRWATQTLQGLGIRPNARNVTALVGWQRAEGGHTNNTARYNFLNTTKDEPGSGDTGSQGNISVYRSFHQGVKGTVDTLKLPAYKGIRQALAHGSPRDVASAIGSSPWGTSASLVTQAITGTPTVRPVAGVVRGESPSLRGSSSGGPGSYTIPGVDNSGTRQQLQLNYLQNSHDPDALLNLAYGLKGAQDTPSRTVRYRNGAPKRTNKVAAPGKLADIEAEAKLIESASVPYQWGGGHQGKQIRGTKVTPLDCSGAVSRVLGINPRVASQFESWGKPGQGKRVTIYAKGDHVLMEINGHFWGTSRSNPGGGAGWISRKQISKQYLSQFTARHPPGL